MAKNPHWSYEKAILKDMDTDWFVGGIKSTTGRNEPKFIDNYKLLYTKDIKEAKIIKG